MTVWTLVSVGAGGALGAVLRYLLNTGISHLHASSFPWGILSVNVLGSFLMGVVVTFFLAASDLSQDMRLFITAGFLGGFTTFSAFALDAMTLFEKGAWSAAVLYIGGSVLLSVLALAAGAFLIRSFAG